MFLSWRIMPRTAGDRALTMSQAFAIVEGTPMGAAPTAAVGIGIYLGMIAASRAGLLRPDHRVKRAAQPYVVSSRTTT